MTLSEFARRFATAESSPPPERPRRNPRCIYCGAHAFGRTCLNCADLARLDRAEAR